MTRRLLCALLAAATLLPAMARDARAQEGPRSDFTRRWILHPSKQTSSDDMDAAAFTAMMERSMLDFGRSLRPAAYPGCPDPDAPSAAGRDYVLDPVAGRDDADGSAEHPLPSLARFLARQARGEAGAPRLKAGDRLVLRAGDHGQATMGDLGNDGFVTIEPEPGAEPVLSSLTVIDAKKVVVRGLRFEAGATEDDRNLVLVQPGASSIVLRDNRFATRTDASWTDADWAQRSRFGLFARGTCISIVGNTFQDLYGGVRSAGEAALIAGNRFEGIVNDNIGFETGRQWIVGNAILNGRNSLDNPLHSDGIQGWTQSKAGASEVVIDGNLVMHYQPRRKEAPDPRRVIAGQRMSADSGIYRQGISIFDGVWSHVRMTGNVVVTNAGFAVSMFGLTDSEIADNVVLSSDPAHVRTRMRIIDAKDGSPTERTVVAGNLVEELEVATRLPAHRNAMISKLVQNARTRPPTRPVPGGPPARWGSVAHQRQESAVRRVDGAAGLYDVRPR